MPRIADAFIDNAVYIYSTLEDAEFGKGFGGSGFPPTFRFERPRIYNKLTS